VNFNQRQSHISLERKPKRGGCTMGNEFKGASRNSASLPQTPKNQKIKPSKMKEEISMELAELGNLNPKHEPMTPNQRQKRESEKTYK
jgi:hypothetical protein